MGEKKKGNKKTSLYCFIISHMALRAWALGEVLLPSSERSKEELEMTQRMTSGKVTEQLPNGVGLNI